ncbi:hypothetical protein M3201_00390 [Paenibacillus motobuensis]|uniref:hypothetical protein n=1 Tax=Paenibacillus TaxID=44249 RepID=UPI00203DF70D|nr:hypothetical protein [Paenibacillus lutimineralis]MCM3645265.1 hypothetical protein [Paenibacillus motobuensis]
MEDAQKWLWRTIAASIITIVIGAILTVINLQGGAMQRRKSGNAQGTDVSHWKGTIDWPKVAANGISFTYIKRPKIAWTSVL